jgi:hypothetical protein
MRKTITIAAAAAVALALSGLAAAHGKSRASGVKAASATFAATTVSHSVTRSCTDTDGTYEIANARYTGTVSSSEPVLAGPATLHVKSVYNTTTKLGWVEGTLRVRDGDGHAVARLFAVNANGQLDGFLNGSTHGWALLASLTSAFSVSGGFTNGQIGTGSATNLAILKGKVDCRAEPQRVSVRLKVRGTVESIADGKINVRPADGSALQSCAIASGTDLSRIDPGDVVDIECAVQNGVLTLTKVKLKDDDDRRGKRR